MNDLLTVAEAAALLSMDEGSVRRALIAGRLRGKKFSRVWQVTRREVELYRATPKRSQGGRPRKTPPAP